MATLAFMRKVLGERGFGWVRGGLRLDTILEPNWWGRKVGSKDAWENR